MEPMGAKSIDDCIDLLFPPSLPMDSPHSASSTHHRKRPLSHTQAALALAGGRGVTSSVDPDDDLDSGCSEDEEGGSVHYHPLMEEELASTQVWESE